MITKAQITRRSSKEGVSARTIERDYVLAHVVAAVAISRAAAKLVFKGGTALRMCHFKEFRYSADLDFSIVDGTIYDGLQIVYESLNNVAGSVSQLELTEDDPPRIAYVGPLNRQRTLKLDIADDEYVVNTETIRIEREALRGLETRDEELRGRPLTDEERETLRGSYIDDEVLLHEALRRGAAVERLPSPTTSDAHAGAPARADR